MLPDTASLLLLTLLFVGYIPAYVAYRFTLNFEITSLSAAVPLSFIGYPGLLLIAKFSFDAIGSKAFIGILVFAVLWGIAVVVRESSNGLFERFSFFGAALTVAAVIWITTLPIFGLMAIITALMWGVDYRIGLALYAFATVFALFTMPLWERLLRFVRIRFTKPN